MKFLFYLSKIYRSFSGTQNVSLSPRTNRNSIETIQGVQKTNQWIFCLVNFFGWKMYFHRSLALQKWYNRKTQWFWQTTNDLSHPCPRLGPFSDAFLSFSFRWCWIRGDVEPGAHGSRVRALRGRRRSTEKKPRPRFVVCWHTHYNTPPNKPSPSSVQRWTAPSYQNINRSLSIVSYFCFTRFF